MQLSFLISQARSGELASLSSKKVTDKEVIDYLNAAMVALYGRFQLAVDEAIIALDMINVRTLYKMDGTDSAVTVRGETIKPEEYMVAVTVTNEDGTVSNLNDDSDPLSCYTVGYNTLQIPLIAEHSYVSVIYRKNPKLITFIDNGTGGATDCIVELPLQLLDATTAYIGYKAHSSITNSVQGEENTLYKRYLEACNQAELLGLLPASSMVQEPVTSKGFV